MLLRRIEYSSLGDFLSSHFIKIIRNSSHKAKLGEEISRISSILHLDFHLQEGLILILESYRVFLLEVCEHIDTRTNIHFATFLEGHIDHFVVPHCCIV